MMVRRLGLGITAALLCSAVAWAAGYRTWRFEGDDVSGSVLMCQTRAANGILMAAPCGNSGAPVVTMGLPFVRATRNAFVMPLTTTPQQFLITQPDTATSYRGFNPCVQADVRIMSVSPIGTMVSEATSYPGVRRVTSQTETIDRLSGIRFSRGSETLGSAQNPLNGPNRIVSAMIVPIPGYPADLSGVTCEFELMYGNAG